MPLPGEQMPGHAPRQLDQWRRPWRRVPRHEPSMRNYIRFIWLDPAISAYLLAASQRRYPLLAEYGQDVWHRPGPRRAAVRRHAAVLLASHEPTAPNGRRSAQRRLDEAGWGTYLPRT